MVFRAVAVLQRKRRTFSTPSQRTMARAAALVALVGLASSATVPPVVIDVRTPWNAAPIEAEARWVLHPWGALAHRTLRPLPNPLCGWRRLAYPRNRGRPSPLQRDPHRSVTSAGMRRGSVFGMHSGCPEGRRYWSQTVPPDASVCIVVTLLSQTPAPRAQAITRQQTVMQHVPP